MNLNLNLFNLCVFAKVLLRVLNHNCDHTKVILVLSNIEVLGFCYQLLQVIISYE